MRDRLTLAAMKKSFGRSTALAGVDLRVAAGEVHAVVGENGAGKSTLMAILGGVLSADSGAMTLEGQAYLPRSPIEARAAGVVMVHQELALCAHLSVAENVTLGSEPTALGVLRRGEARARVASAIARVLGPEHASRLPLDARAGDLSTADQQLVEIARALSNDHARVLILDEPTSSLASDDAERLFALIRKLREDGLTILYISHFLEEVMRLADRFTVLRDGASVASGAIAETSIEALVEKMAGRKVEQLVPVHAKKEVGEVLLRVTDLEGIAKPKSASFELRRGEVLGIAGLVGAGRTELLRVIFGLDPVRRGTIQVGAFAGPASPARRLAQGVGLLSEDRKREGLALSRSIAENITLSKPGGLGPRGFVLPSREREAAQKWMTVLAIRADDPAQPVFELSGGNQQKVALARLLHHDVDVLLLDEPTRGIDVASKAQIYERIGGLAASNKAVLVVSSYLPELFGVCDRIAVMCRGVLGIARPTRDLDERAVLREATGA